jgi:hypothetical protein
LNRNRLNGCAALLALALAAGAAPVVARHTLLVLPIQPALASAAAKRAIGTDIPVSFGSALPNGLSIVNESVVANGRFDPRASTDPNRAVGPPSNDEEACVGAFVAAVASLAKQARRLDATSVVGVVGYAEAKETEITDKFECHVGMTRAEVDLKGMAAVRGSGNGPTLTSRSARVVTPVLGAAVPAAPATPLNRHRSAVPAATGFAKGDDASAVPLSEAGKERYRHYLSLPAPKAFVIYKAGGWRFYSDDADAMTKALDYCERESKPCWLYAVDDRVVWSDAVSKRIGKSAQLGNE